MSEKELLVELILIKVSDIALIKNKRNSLSTLIRGFYLTKEL